MRESRFRLALAAAAATAVWLSPVAAAPTSLPCDIYASGNTPCVAAHSTTRALYGSFNGPLYQVTRNSDGATSDVRPLAAGGVADASSQDRFCSGSTCVISIIYDQSGHGNDLSRAPGGKLVPGPRRDHSDYLASAIGAPVTINGQKAYGVFISPGTGYRNNHAKDTAIGDESEGMYAVLDGTHFNDKCCFDYGNAETNNADTGAGHMEAIYFGTAGAAHAATGAGNGPWIKADIEDGLYAGQFKKEKNLDNPSQSSRFLTAVIKGKPNQFAIRGGNATSGPLSTYYNGERPAGYTKMHLEGAIILGMGGDNNYRDQGTFYEGVMVSGFPSDSTENSVQSNIVAARYAPGELNTGSPLSIGSIVSFHVTTPIYNDRYLTHTDSTIDTRVVSASSNTEDKQSAGWIVRRGIGKRQCYSFEAAHKPGYFIRHDESKLSLAKNDASKAFGEYATFCTQPGLNGKGHSIRSWNFPTRYIRHYHGIGYLSCQSGPQESDASYLYADDVSFVIEKTDFD